MRIASVSSASKLSELPKKGEVGLEYEVCASLMKNSAADRDGNSGSRRGKAAMEVIRGRERDCRQEIRGQLDAEERDRLQRAICKGKRSAQLLTKARILLEGGHIDAGEGWSDSRIAAALDTSIATVERTRRQPVEEGFEAVLACNSNLELRPAADFRRRAEAKLIALTSPAPEGFARWPASARGEGPSNCIPSSAPATTQSGGTPKTFSSRIASSNG